MQVWRFYSSALRWRTHCFAAGTRRRPRPVRPVRLVPGSLLGSSLSRTASQGIAASLALLSADPPPARDTSVSGAGREAERGSAGQPEPGQAASHPGPAQLKTSTWRVRECLLIPVSHFLTSSCNLK